MSSLLIATPKKIVLRLAFRVDGLIGMAVHQVEHKRAVVIGGGSVKVRYIVESVSILMRAAVGIG